MSRIKKVQEYLIEIEDFLKLTLRDENLSIAAQIKRRHLLDRFYALELQANDDRNPLGSTVTHNRSASSSSPPSTTTTTTTTSSSQPVEQNKKDVSVTKPEYIRDDRQEESVYNLYEEPVIYSKLDDDDDDDDVTDGGIPQASFAQAEDCSDTEYESFDDDDNGDIGKGHDPGHHDNNRTNRDLPLPQVRKASGNNEMNLLSRLPNVQHSGHLYQKGLLSWLKRFCIISDSRLLTFRSRKHLRPLSVLDLIGCDVESVVRENSKYKYALKISRPTQAECQQLSNSIHSSVINSNNINNSSSLVVGGETSCCWFYAGEKLTIDGWMLRLCLSGCLRVGDDVTVENVADAVDTDSGVCASTCDNQASISGGSSEGGSGDGMTSGGSTGLERKPSNGSSTGMGLALKKKLKIGESLQSLIWGQFKGRKDDKDDKVKRAFIEAGGLDADVTHLAGYINVNSALSSEGQGHWVKKFCVGRQGRLDCYKDPLDENVEFNVPLRNSVVVDGDRQTKRICLSCEMSTNGERAEVGLEFFNLNNFNKWLVLIYKESDGRESIAEGVYNEVYDWKVYNTAAECQPPPLPKERPHSKVIPSSGQSDCDVQSTNNNNNNIYEPYTVKGLSSIAEDSFLAADFIHEDDSFHLEEIMASAFDDIKRNLNEGKCKPPKEAPHSKPSTLNSKPLYSSPTSRPLASLPTSSNSFSPSICSSPLREVGKGRGEYKSPRCLLITVPSSSSSIISSSISSSSLTSSSSSASSSSSVSTSSSSKMMSPPRPAPPLKYRPPDTLNKISTDPTSPIKSTPAIKNGVRSSSVPRTNSSPSSGPANKIYAVPPSSKPTNHIVSSVTASSNRNSLVQSSFDFSLIKNELNKRHSVVNYNLNNAPISTNIACKTHSTTSINNNNNHNHNHPMRNNNLYSRPEKVAGSFMSGHEPAKTSKAISTTSIKTTHAVTTTSSSLVTTSTQNEVKSTSAVVSCSINPSSSVTSTSRALATKMSVTSMTSISSTTSSSSSSLTSSSSSSATTKLSTKSTSPIVSSVAKRTKPADLRVVAAANSDLVSKRSSLVALTVLSSSNSKLREARAEIRKSSLELMSILPNTSNKMAVEKTFSAPVTTGNNYVAS